GWSRPHGADCMSASTGGAKTAKVSAKNTNHLKGEVEEAIPRNQSNALPETPRKHVLRGTPSDRLKTPVDTLLNQISHHVDRIALVAERRIHCDADVDVFASLIHGPENSEADQFASVLPFE